MTSPCLHCQHLSRSKDHPDCVSCDARVAYVDELEGRVRVKIKIGVCRLCGARSPRDTVCRRCRSDLGGLIRKFEMPPQLISLEKERIKFLYQQGVPANQIAASMRLNIRQVPEYLGVGRKSLGRLADAAVKDIVHRYRRGEKIVDIAALYGVSRMTIGNVLSRRNVSVKRVRRTPAQVEDFKARVKALRADGLSYAKCAQQIGVSSFLARVYARS